MAARQVTPPFCSLCTERYDEQPHGLCNQCQRVVCVRRHGGFHLGLFLCVMCDAPDVMSEAALTALLHPVVIRDGPSGPIAVDDDGEEREKKARLYATAANTAASIRDVPVDALHCYLCIPQTAETLRRSFCTCTGCGRTMCQEQHLAYREGPDVLCTPCRDRVQTHFAIMAHAGQTDASVGLDKRTTPPSPW